MSEEEKAAAAAGLQDEDDTFNDETFGADFDEGAPQPLVVAPRASAAAAACAHEVLGLLTAPAGFTLPGEEFDFGDHEAVASTHETFVQQRGGRSVKSDADVRPLLALRPSAVLRSRPVARPRSPFVRHHACARLHSPYVKRQVPLLQDDMLDDGLGGLKATTTIIIGPDGKRTIEEEEEDVSDLIAATMDEFFGFEVRCFTRL